MSWFVFEESELGVMESSGAERLEELVPKLREKGEWTDDDTLLVNVNGVKSTALASYGKLPRRMASDPPTDTSPKYSEEPGVAEINRGP